MENLSVVATNDPLFRTFVRSSEAFWLYFIQKIRWSAPLFLLYL